MRIIIIHKVIIKNKNIIFITILCFIYLLYIFNYYIIQYIILLFIIVSSGIQNVNAMYNFQYAKKYLKIENKEQEIKNSYLAPMI